MRKILGIILTLIIFSAALQASGAQFKGKAKENRTREFMQICATGSSNEILKALRANPDMNVNIYDDKRITPLMYAAMKHSPEVVNALLRAGANMENTDGNRENAFVYAARFNENTETIKALINGYVAARVEEIKGRNSRGPRSPFEEKPDARKFAREVINQNHMLVYAAASNTPNVVKMLIDLGADVNDDRGFHETPLITAASLNKNPKVIEALIEGGAEDRPNFRGETALMYAAGNNNIEALKVLIKAGADVNAETKQKTTALQYATDKGNIECVKILIEAGAKR